MKITRKKILNSILLLIILSFPACIEDTTIPTVTTTSTSPNSRARKTLPDENNDLTESNWVAAKNWKRTPITRNPFKGFLDIAPENLAQEQLPLNESDTTILPAQKYDLKDFKLVGVITGTADPKAFLIDPSGNRHTLRRGDLIGNKNGTIANIARNKIDVFELISGEGKYTEIHLHPENESNPINIKLH